MSKPIRVSNPIHSFLPLEVKGFDSLAELALDMHFYWNHSADEVWKQLDPALWELTYNPWVVLQTVSRDRIELLSADPVFRRKVDDLLEAKRHGEESPAWFQQNHSEIPLTSVAYFSMEFMLSEALPIYSGGLGNVAGDQLKTASDLGLPVVGVGLLYQQGYFRQVIDQDGSQQALFPYNDPGQLPITPLREPDGEWLRLELTLPGYSVWLRAWQVQVGRVKLYLLDSNDPANFPARRGITSELYGGGPELRLNQELVLGIGGWRLLEALGLKPEVCHLNEGHAAFAVLERARTFMEETGQSFEVALAVTRAGNLFTTHTPVTAGFDRFSPVLMEQYLGWYAQKELDISLQELLALGRAEPERFPGTFQYGLPGRTRKRCGQWGQPLARTGEPAYLSAAFSALAGRRSAGGTRDQRGSYVQLGFGGDRCPVDRILRQGPLAGHAGDPGSRHAQASRLPALGMPCLRSPVPD